LHLFAFKKKLGIRDVQEVTAASGGMEGEGEHMSTGEENVLATTAEDTPFSVDLSTMLTHLNNYSVMAGLREGVEYAKKREQDVPEYKIGGFEGKYSDTEMEESTPIPQTVEELLGRLVSPKPKEKLQQSVMYRLHRIAFSELLNGVDDCRRAIIISQANAGAREWLKCAPFIPQLRLSAEAFSWSLFKWLGGVTSEDEEAKNCTHCRRYGEDTSGDHVAKCRVGRGRIARHDNIVQIISKIVRASGRQVRVEDRGADAAFGQGGPDITVHNFPEEGVDSYIEVAITSPVNDKARAKASKESLVATAQMQHVKKTKYANGAEQSGMHLYTSTFETTGALGRDTRKLVSALLKTAEEVGRLEKMVPSNVVWSSASPKHFCYQLLSVTMRRSLHRQALDRAMAIMRKANPRQQREVTTTDWGAKARGGASTRARHSNRRQKPTPPPSSRDLRSVQRVDAQAQNSSGEDSDWMKVDGPGTSAISQHVSSPPSSESQVCTTPSPIPPKSETASQQSDAPAIPAEGTCAQINVASQ